MAKGMSRILIVLALAILLLPAPHNSKPATVQPGALLVTTRALPLSTNDPALRRVGALAYLGGWELRSANPGFGGISAMLVSPPGDVLAFLVPSGMGVNLRAGVWHGVLTPLDRAADFLVVDREGEGVNLEEVRIAPVSITA